MSSITQSLGKYQLTQSLSGSNRAEVYKATLEGIAGFRRPLAIKLFRPKLCSNYDFITALTSEAKVAGQLSHANIVQVVDLGVEGGDWFLAMELVEGTNLAQLLQRAADKSLTLPLPHTLYITSELLRALEYGHNFRHHDDLTEADAERVMHMRVDPTNVLISFAGEIKLTNFGLSSIEKTENAYLSPEQKTGGEIDTMADLYSVGVIMHKVLTGELPAYRRKQLISRALLASDLPRSLVKIVTQSLQLEPANRFPSAAAFKAELDQFVHEFGFVFDHPSMANYLQGLFPEVNIGTTLPKPSEKPSLDASDNTNTKVGSLKDPTLFASTPSPNNDEMNSEAPASITPVSRVWSVIVGATLMALGIAIGATIAFLALYSATPSTLSVQIPNGSSVTIDGIPAQRETSLEANTKHRVIVTHSDGSVESTTLSLQPGEDRILVIKSHQ